VAQRSRKTDSARGRAAQSVARLVRAYPDLHTAEPPVAGLDERDARLALAIYRSTVRRWLTLRWLLGRFLRHGIDKVEPAVQAVLMTGAAQTLFMDRIAAHAAVDESVELVKKWIRPAAGSLVNAVLRKIAALPESREPQVGYFPAPHRLPWQGGWLQLREPLLPPVKTLEEHLAVATSHPRPLVRAWLDRFGEPRAVDLLLHSLQEAPTIICAPGGLPGNPTVEPHEQPGFYVWRGESGELAALLDAAGAWVQDPATHRAVAATAGCRPQRIIDYCAGRGTKTLQLHRLHPAASILASDPDPDRYEELRRRFAGMPAVTILPHEQIHAHQADLVVLDVPCSNSGVLARRLEARYRYSAESVASVVALQREIFEGARPLLAPGGAILYITCSIELAENEEQVRSLSEAHKMAIEEQDLMLPGGRSATYHDGGYYAILRPT
jgi:16S rRNA (cytosine967-C5)-methyltransferase